MSQKNDDLYAFLISEGIPAGHINDMAHAWLITQGIPSGHINDMWAAYYAEPSILNSALVWMDETTIQQTAGNLTSWDNKATGGAGYNLDVITGTINIVQKSGKDVLNFNGSSYVNPTALINLTQPNRVYAVYELTDLTTQIICRVYDSFLNTSLRNHLGLDKNNDFHWIESGVVLPTPNGSLTAAPEVSSALFNGVSSSLKINNLTEVVGSAGAQSWHYCTLGANAPKTAGQMMLGTINTFIVFGGGTLPTISEDTQIRNYLRNRWGAL